LTMRSGVFSVMFIFPGGFTVLPEESYHMEA
jgi:hypothetical protein